MSLRINLGLAASALAAVIGCRNSRSNNDVIVIPPSGKNETAQAQLINDPLADSETKSFLAFSFSAKDLLFNKGAEIPIYDANDALALGFKLVGNTNDDKVAPPENYRLGLKVTQVLPNDLEWKWSKEKQRLTVVKVRPELQSVRFTGIAWNDKIRKFMIQTSRCVIDTNGDIYQGKPDFEYELPSGYLSLPGSEELNKFSDEGVYKITVGGKYIDNEKGRVYQIEDGPYDQKRDFPPDSGKYNGYYIDGPTGEKVNLKKVVSLSNPSLV